MVRKAIASQSRTPETKVFRHHGNLIGARFLHRKSAKCIECVQCTVCRVQSAQCAECCAVCAVQCAVHTVLRFHCAGCAMWNRHSPQSTDHSLQCAEYIVRNARNVQCEACVPCGMHSTMRKMHTWHNAQCIGCGKRMSSFAVVIMCGVQSTHSVQWRVHKGDRDCRKLWRGYLNSQGLVRRMDVKCPMGNQRGVNRVFCIRTNHGDGAVSGSCQFHLDSSARSRDLPDFLTVYPSPCLFA